MVYDAIWTSGAMIGIYKITSPSGKIYIGSSVDIKRRIIFYRKLHCKGQVKLYKSILKYGWDNHKLEVLEICSLEELRSKEYEYGMFYNVLSDCGLNLSLPKVGDVSGLLSDETKKKMSDTHKRIYNSDTQKRLYEGRKKVGWNPSNETKAKISKGLSKRVIHIETGKEFDSLKIAAIFFNIPYGTLTSQMKRGGPKKKFDYL